jgi:TonB family protein
MARLGISLICLFIVRPACAENGPKQFAYISPQYIITAEVASEHSFVLNFINLSDFVIVTQPGEFIYRGASGRFYNGQVFDAERKDNRGDISRYSASILLKGHSFTDLTLIGAFHELEEIEELSLRIGAKRFYLQPLEEVQFELLAAKIGELDLENPDSRAALKDANIQDLGNIKTTDGTSEWDKDWQNLMNPDGINVPKVIEHPPILPPDDSKYSNISGKIRLSAFISKSGGIQDLKIIKGIDKELDERALRAVQNSWTFLPATKNGEVLETTIFFEVEFSAPVKK